MKIKTSEFCKVVQIFPNFFLYNCVIEGHEKISQENGVG